MSAIPTPLPGHPKPSQIGVGFSGWGADWRRVEIPLRSLVSFVVKAVALASCQLLFAKLLVFQ
jgi:hypothetical protein